MSTGKVIQSTGSWYKIISPDNEIIECRLKGKMRLENNLDTNPVAVGDEVEFERNTDGTGCINRILERHNQIIRQATHGRRGNQVIAANIDLAFCVQSVRRPQYKTGFIDRFLVTCEAYDVAPVILMNKTDLARSHDTEKLEAVECRYNDLGYKFIKNSIFDEESLSRIRQLTKNKISVFIGPSGTGKSSILNVLDPKLNLPVSEISDFSGKGKHTTTFATLIRLSYGAWLVDTPGIREFGLVDIEPAELSHFFPEMRDLRESCRFYNCTHIHEPGCAVHAALEKRKINQSRYESYCRILDSL